MFYDCRYTTKGTYKLDILTSIEEGREASTRAENQKCAANTHLQAKSEDSDEAFEDHGESQQPEWFHDSGKCHLIIVHAVLVVDI